MTTDNRAPWWVWPRLLLFLPLVAVAFVLWLGAAIVLQLIVWTVWCSRGRYALVVYSSSPIWQEYFEEYVLPAVGNRGVVLNWSERKQSSYSLPVALFRFFAGTREFNPLVVVFQPLAWPRRFRFYGPFQAFKHGRPQEVEDMRRDLSNCWTVWHHSRRPRDGSQSVVMEAPLRDADAEVAQIRGAFSNVPHVARKSLVYEGSWETDDILRNLAKVQDTPTDQFVEWHADSLPVFTPEGLRHVLPYYMEYTLRHPRSEAAERLIFHLAPAETGDDYWSTRLNVFSAAQKAAICALLTFLERELVGEHYDSHFARAHVVWAYN